MSEPDENTSNLKRGNVFEVTTDGGKSFQKFEQKRASVRIKDMSISKKTEFEITVSELIAELEKLDSKKIVKIWSAGIDDDETTEVYVKDKPDAVWIESHEF